ncbi:MAG TPA: PilZ domain-containing protein [Nitrospiria bacterium]|jgi:hypothetical protein|nr:PilZ domain-containing protein [Nitrospiria bacterium]
MSRPTKEKREAKRALYVRPVDFRPMGGLSGRGEILDMGNGGARIRTGTPPPDKGTVVQAWIPLTEHEIAVPVLGLVRWMKREGREVYQVGFQFLI